MNVFNNRYNSYYYLNEAQIAMKVISIISLILMVSITACQKRDTDTNKQDQTTTPHSVDKDS